MLTWARRRRSSGVNLSADTGRAPPETADMRRRWNNTVSMLRLTHVIVAANVPVGRLRV